MTVEEVIRGNLEGEDRNYDNFPVGMRVLAVDDDPICLKLLDGLLRKCQYNVTTTSQARIALKMLRENRDRFDLVISDVHMPDMDGFKLLELIGLEMDLPVIMLSANSDPKLVMKGVTHGACDYLVKPIRIEELRNIWQHVIRRKNSDSRKPGKSSDLERSLPGNGEGGGQGNLQSGNSDQIDKFNKRRKEDESEADENEQEQDDSSTQKKPRVVWSIELHRKFVAAVNQLGIEKAVPKRILDMMNVEGLTRENVASHLQKYRIYLKRISSVASQKAYMVAAIGGKDSAYMRTGSLDGFGDFRALTGAGRYTSPAFSSYTQAAMLGRLNSPAGVGLRSVASSAMVQPSLVPNMGGTLGKLHPLVSPVATQNASLFQGVPSSLELDQLQQNKCSISVRDYNPLDDSSGILNGVATFSNTRPPAVVNLNNNAGIPNKDLVVVSQRNSQQASTAGGYVNHSSVNLNTFSNEPFDLDVGDSTTFLDRNRRNSDWPGAVQLSKFHSNSLSATESFSQGQLTRGTSTSSGLHLPITPLEFSSTNAVSVPLEDSVVGQPGQEALGQQQRWGENKQSYPHNSGRASVSASTFVQQTDIDRPITVTDTRPRSSGDSILGQTKSEGACVPHNYDSLDDIMNNFIKREQNGNIFDGDIPFDAYAFGSCI